MLVTLLYFCRLLLLAVLAFSYFFFSEFSITIVMYLQANEVVYHLLQKNFFFVHKCNKGKMKE